MKSLRPKTLSEVSNSLKEMTEKSKFIGGGTDLIIRLNSGVVPDCLCYLGYINEYKEITETDTHIYIGAYCNMTQIEKSPIVNEYLKALVDAVSDVGSLQIRNNGTIGGNIGNASPAGDLLPVLYLFKADIHTISPNGKRVIPINKIIECSGKTTLDYNEAITHIVIEKPHFQSAFVKLGSRKKVTISRIGACIGIEFLDQQVKEIEIYIGAISTKPIRLTQAEEFIKNKPLTEENTMNIAKFLSDYIYENTPEEFDRDYKVSASKGIIFDVFELIKTRTHN